MLDDFFSTQKVAYNILKNSINKKCFSHAYLINTNGNKNGFDFAKALTKSILCPFNKTSCQECNGCIQCNLIDNNSFSDYYNVECDGLWIKKEQTDNLQNEFSKKAICSNYKVYTINDVENLNKSAANSILKFLEEPEEGIIAILVTNNINKVLDTIISRCQVINLNNYISVSSDMLYNIGSELFNTEEQIDQFTNSSESYDKINFIIKFIKSLKTQKLDTLLYINELWFDHFNTNDDFLIGFDLMILFYKDVFNYKIGRDIIFKDYINDIEDFSCDDFNRINKIINLLILIKNDLFCNVNLNLLMDKFIIRIGEIYG